MYSVVVSSEVFIAHSLKHRDFGPASNLHGATLNIELEVYSRNLDDKNTVIDIGQLGKILEEESSRLHYQNLDNIAEFENEITTIDYLTGYLWMKLKGRLVERGFDLGANGLIAMKIKIKESSTAGATFYSEFE